MSLFACIWILFFPAVFSSEMTEETAGRAETEAIIAILKSELQRSREDFNQLQLGYSQKKGVRGLLAYLENKAANGKMNGKILLQAGETILKAGELAESFNRRVQRASLNAKSQYQGQSASEAVRRDILDAVIDDLLSRMTSLKSLEVLDAMVTGELIDLENGNYLSTYIQNPGDSNFQQIYSRPTLREIGEVKAYWSRIRYTVRQIIQPIRLEQTLRAVNEIISVRQSAVRQAHTPTAAVGGPPAPDSLLGMINKQHMQQARQIGQQIEQVQQQMLQVQENSSKIHDMREKLALMQKENALLSSRTH